MAENKIGQTETILYSIIATIIYGSGFSVFTWLPLFYYFSFSLIKKYLEKQTDPVPLNVLVFSHLDIFFLIIKIILLILGVTYCIFAMHRFHFYTRLKRIACLSVPINIRFNAIATTILALILLACGIYFGGQLLNLAEPEPSITMYIAKFLVRISPEALIKYGLEQSENFKKAKIIFDDINLVSYFFYLTCHVISTIMSAALFFITATTGTASKK